ncbi:MAG TPA: sigma 54-interacting transcriptional regulator [Thermoanaerobaculia bacterium]|nr:sigma 54-interacting transcriptional regulator [Thermoanaerobaculia bacterium]
MSDSLGQVLSRISKALDAGQPAEEIRPLLSELTSECERISEADRERRRRAEALEALLPTLAQALDIREVFQQLAGLAREVIPYEILELGVLNEERTRARLYAASDLEEPSSVPEIQLPQIVQSTLSDDYFILDIEEIEVGDPLCRARVVLRTSQLPEGRPMELQLPLERIRRQLAIGVRSHLRVPIRIQGEMVGALLFFSSQSGRYRLEDVDAARRIADHIALTLAHERLAEEQRRAAEAREQAERLSARVEALTEELAAKGGHRPVGVSRKWKDVLALATKVAGTETTVLLTGESGTGKEVVARFLHRASPRTQGPFVALNCAALPEQLLESELFGYEKGAFTGALSARPGKIEQAAGGVLFLDEVGEMSPAVQAKFLRVLQEREFQRLGGARVLKADVRVVAATNRDLKAAIAQGEFREDLYYRLLVFEIRLPPLRDRPEDIPALLEAFLREIGESVGRPAAGISRDARQKLLAYSWPGNVRELRNAVERAVILAEGGLVTGEHLPISIGEPPALPASTFPVGGVDLEDLERTYVEQALKQTGHNKSRAARLLGLTRAQLYSRLEKYGL